MSYATEDDLAKWTAFYGMRPPPPGDETDRLLALASRDVSRHLGAEYDLADPALAPEQVAALRDGSAVQACYRIGQGSSLGLDDGLAGVGELRFSMRTPARFSPEAAEILAGLGLYVRTGTVPLPDDDEAA